MPYLRIISGLQFCRWLLKIQKLRKVAHEFSVVQRVGIQLFTLILRLGRSRKWFVVFSLIIKVDTKDWHFLVFVFLRMVLVCVCVLVCFVDGTTSGLLVLCAFQQMCLQRAVWSTREWGTLLTIYLQPPSWPACLPACCREFPYFRDRIFGLH
jgi:hypothetical protein